MPKKPKKSNPVKIVEVTRSFAYKHNLGNYQSLDLFCSQKAETTLQDAEKTSEALYTFCKSEVVKSLNEYVKWGLKGEAEYLKEHPPIVYKEGQDPNEKKEVMAHLQQDIKKEDDTNIKTVIHI
jgi:hypothetical protein